MKKNVEWRWVSRFIKRMQTLGLVVDEALMKMSPFKDNEKLSNLVQNYPYFYDKKVKDYKEEDKVQRAWEDIAFLFPDVFFLF